MIPVVSDQIGDHRELLSDHVSQQNWKIFFWKFFLENFFWEKFFLKFFFLKKNKGNKNGRCWKRIQHYQRWGWAPKLIAERHPWSVSFFRAPLAHGTLIRPASGKSFHILDIWKEEEKRSILETQPYPKDIPRHVQKTIKIRKSFKTEEKTHFEMVVSRLIDWFIDCCTALAPVVTRASHLLTHKSTKYDQDFSFLCIFYFYYSFFFEFRIVFFLNFSFFSNFFWKKKIFEFFFFLKFFFWNFFFSSTWTRRSLCAFVGRVWARWSIRRICVRSRDERRRIALCLKKNEKKKILLFGWYHSDFLPMIQANTSGWKMVPLCVVRWLR